MNWVPAFLTKFWLTDFVESLWKICLGRFVLEGLSQKICLGRFVWNVCLEHSSRKVQKVLSRNLHLGMEWVIAIDLYKDQCFSYFSNLNNSIQAHFAERLWKITNHTSEHANSMSTKNSKGFLYRPYVTIFKSIDLKLRIYRLFSFGIQLMGPVFVLWLL